MPKHIDSKTAATKRTPLTATTRPAREPESSYIAQTRRPELGNKAEYVRGGFERGVSLRDLIKGSGLKPRTVLSLVGMSPDEHVNLVAELEAFRTDLLNHRN